MNPDLLCLIGLGVIMGLVLVLPFSVRWVEEELEIFLLVMGSLAVTVSGLWSRHLVWEALTEPWKISLAVFVFGFLFRLLRDTIRRNIAQTAEAMGMRYFLFGFVVVLGLLSNVITAIIASLVLVEVISGLRLSKDRERSVVILACYSIGMGAALTPIGEPLSTIAVAKLAGPPHHADFFFLAQVFGAWIVPGLFILGALAMRLAGPQETVAANTLTEDKPEEMKDIIVRAVKVYAFVAALVLLGKGFMPVVDRYVLTLPSSLLYWVNMISAVLDNATLTAAELSPQMSLPQIKSIIMGLIIAGGMLIPGNIPNIIAANKLGIKSKEWAKGAVPLGLVLMLGYFIVLQLI